jgi:sarcosine oxidase gamma subunit
MATILSIEDAVAIAKRTLGICEEEHLPKKHTPEKKCGDLGNHMTKALRELKYGDFPPKEWDLIRAQVRTLLGLHPGEWVVLLENEKKQRARRIAAQKEEQEREAQEREREAQA